MPVAEIQKFTFSEVAQKNGKGGNEVWIVIRDVVYDVTNFLEEHPGSSEIMMEYAGKDATKDYEDFGHSGDAKRLLKSFKIGELVEEEQKYNRKKSTKTQNIEVSENIIKKRRRRRFLLCS